MLSEFPRQLDPYEVMRLRVKAYRAKAGLGQREFAKLLGYQQATIAKVESGERTVSDGLAEALDAKLDTRGEFTMLLALARVMLIEPGAREVLSREPEAARIRAFSSSVIPGLLQTEEYARALTRASRPHESSERVEEIVAARMQRQQRTLRREGEPPPLYRAVIDEAALARPVGSDQAMSGQLRELIALRESTRIKVQIIPFHARQYGMMGGNLSLFDLKGGALALVENFRVAQGVEAPPDVVAYAELFESAQENALDVEASVALISRYKKEYDDGRASVAQEHP